ncbi:MAG: hypothetical protein QOC81_4592 [Thermoanaerobaculia bacterium]|jgi:hypothetical protein|nr:hypothetical protein [Thermoanaerobaculia bacterium]
MMPLWKDRERLAKWFDAMNAHGRTRITLSNLKYDLGKRNRVPLWRLLRVLHAMMIRGFWKPGIGGHDEAEAAFEVILNGAPASLFCNGPVIKNRGRLSLITDDASFHKYYVRLSSRATVIDRKARVPKFATIYEKEVRDGATIKTGREFAWVTDSDALQDQIDHAKSGRVPKRVRDFLGLIFKAPKQRLIELRYPPEVAKSLALAAPTSLEGACVTVYRSNDGREGWGASLDLEYLRDGAVEAVHRPIPFTSAFEYRDLGTVGDKRVLTETELSPLFVLWTPADSARVGSLSKRAPRRKGTP